MGVPPGGSAALHRAEGAAVVVAYAVFMDIAAIGDTVVDMPPGEGAAVHWTDGDAGGSGGGSNRGSAAMVSTAVVAMGGNGQRQQRQGQDAEDDLFESHNRGPPYTKRYYFHNSTMLPVWQGLAEKVQSFFITF